MLMTLSGMHFFTTTLRRQHTNIFAVCWTIAVSKANSPKSKIQSSFLTTTFSPQLAQKFCEISLDKIASFASVPEKIRFICRAHF